MKIVSWNVNGVRAIAKKGFEDSLNTIAADVLCLQETKAQDDQVAEVIKDYGYHYFSNSAVKKGYSGTAILSKSKPINVTADLGIEEHDQEGRVLTAEFDSFYLVNVYVPNSGNGLKRIDYRETWDTALLNHLIKLEKTKPVILCGDLNCAHQPMDLKNDKSNYNRTAGYTQREIDGLSRFMEKGYVDSFRNLHPDEVAYSWWSYRMNARANNVGWRIDYFLVSGNYMNNVEEAFILPDHLGSDHCPVGILLN